MKYINDEKGFTLVELLIALAILSVGLLALAGMQVSAITGNKSASRLSAMTAVAQGVMENIMSRPASDSFFGSGPTANTAVATNATNCDIDPSALVGSNTFNMQAVGTLTATYSIVRNNPVTNVAMITVTVTVPAAAKTISIVNYKRVL